MLIGYSTPSSTPRQVVSKAHSTSEDRLKHAKSLALRPVKLPFQSLRRHFAQLLQSV